jgi:hypothetical protein
MINQNRVELDSWLESKMLKAYLDVLNEYEALGLLKESIITRMVDADNDRRGRLHVRLDRIQVRMEVIWEVLSPMINRPDDEWLK